MTRARARSERPTAGVTIRAGALRVGERELPLLSGALHYYRLDPACWEPAIASVKAMGFPIVESYVPWGVHELAPGRFDFGQRDPRRDLARFVALCDAQEMLVFLRPGPHINAEMTYFGLPERISHDKGCQARSPRQNPVVLFFPPRMFPVPSYASERFHEETARWYEAVGDVIAPHLYPAGPVVLLQVDNEAAYYFRNGPYCQDYHPDALALFRQHAERRAAARGQDAEELARAYGIAPGSDEELAPPAAFEATAVEELARPMDWASFQEALLVHALDRMRGAMTRAGLAGVPVVHNVALGDMGLPLSPPALAETVDLLGFDYYHSAREHETVKRRTLYLAGTFALPYAPELGAGAPPWFTPLSHDDSQLTAMTALAFGLRGFNLYMAVDRDRWYGAPVDARGEAREEAERWRALVEALVRTGFHRLRRPAQVALVLPREYARLSRATHLLGPVSPSTVEAMGGAPVDGCRQDTLGLRQPIQLAWWDALRHAAGALDAAGIPYVYVDADAPPARLEGMRVVLSPTYELADPARWALLRDAAEAGAVVGYGPHLPDRDEVGRPATFEASEAMRRVSLESRADAEALVAELAAELGLEAPFPVTPSPLQTAAHHDERGPRVLFVINPTGDKQRAEVTLPEAMSARDALSGEALPCEDRALRLPIGPHTARMIELSRAPADPRETAPAPRPRARRKKKRKKTKEEEQ